MKVRTFYWHDRVVSGPELLLRRLLRRAPYHHFRVGNAGDLLGRELIEARYGVEVVNDPSAGRRLLVVGSVGHRIKPGDWLCGIGVKTPEVPAANEVPVRIWALRGPLSRDVFARAGHDVSDLRFMLDPGLLIRFLVSDLRADQRPGGPIFIPHYRERARHIRQLPRGIRFVDIDDTPRNVARAVLGAELVYSSSLHGVIFAHALERPCVLVRPETDEPMLKYEDYYASVDVPLPKPLDSIWSAKLAATPSSPATLRYSASDFVFPDLRLLEEAGIAF